MSATSVLQTKPFDFFHTCRRMQVPVLLPVSMVPWTHSIHTDLMWFHFVHFAELSGVKLLRTCIRLLLLPTVLS